MTAATATSPDLRVEGRERLLESRRRESHRKGSSQDSGHQPPVKEKEAITGLGILPSLSPSLQSLVGVSHWSNSTGSQRAGGRH